MKTKSFQKFLVVIGYHDYDCRVFDSGERGIIYFYRGGRFRDRMHLMLTSYGMPS